MKKVHQSWILGSAAVALVSAAALWPARSPASERRDALIAGGPFEGKLTMVMDATTLPKPVTMTYEIKGQKARFSMPSTNPALPSGDVIVDRAAQKSWLVIDERRTVFTLDSGKVIAEMSGASQMTPSTAVEKTGQFDTVAGYRCEKWEITAGADHISACVIEGLSIAGPGGDSGVAEQGAFPLRAIQTDASGTVVKHTEVRKIERAAIDDSRFQFPSEYSVEDVLKVIEQAEQDKEQD